MYTILLTFMRQPRKAVDFLWTFLRMLILAFVDRILFPFACRPIAFRTEMMRCYLGASLSCFLELVFSAPPGLDAGEYKRVELNNVPAIVVPPETRLENLATNQKDGTVVLLYAHGGGYLFGEPLMYIESYKRWIREADAAGIKLVVVSVDYRLTTSAKFPAYRTDFIESYRHLIFERGISPESIFFGGDSAGGNLCAISAIYARNTGIPTPAGLILLSPWLDLTHDHTLYSPGMKTDFLITFTQANPMLVDKLLPSNMVASNPQISPVFDDLRDLPPQIVYVGSAEVLLPDSLNWTRRSIQAGNSVDLVLDQGQVHMYPMGRPFCSKSVETKTNMRLIRFIKEIRSGQHFNKVEL